MDRKSMKSLAPARLSDDALATVSGAKLAFYMSPITNVQTNLSGPIVQLAAGNGGSVTQVAGVLQGNSVSF